jgi:hypothetical protein
MAKKAVKVGAASAASTVEPEHLAAAGTPDTDETVGKKAKREEENEYEVLEAGTVIGDQHFPLKDAKKGEEMIVKLTHSVAQQHQMQGVPLRRRSEE